MTTKPKAKKFRIRRSGPLPQPQAAELPAGSEKARKQPDLGIFAERDDGFGAKPYPTARKSDAPAAEAPAADAPEPKPAAAPSKADELAAIAAEGHTTRQLRIARRLAQKHQLSVESDYDAVRLLRRKGIDPFQRSSLLELVTPERDADTETRNTLPAVTPEAPVPAQYDDVTRARELYRIQRDIAARRKRKLIAMYIRLAVFVFLPTFLVGHYFYNVATPLYATNTEFLIQQADGGGSSGVSGLFSGTGLATSQDSITVQGYLQSREAMLRLDDDIGFKTHFSQDNIDLLRRLPADASNEQAYRLYKKMVRIGYDPTEGIVKMEVIAADPELSSKYAHALLDYAEEQVDQLTQRLREDQMRGARETYDEAEVNMMAAQERVLSLQERLGIIDATSETSALMNQVTSLETQVTEKRLQLRQLLDNARPNQARVDGVRGDISRLEALIADMRAELTTSGGKNESLARISAEMRMAELDLETRTLMMQQALEQMEGARIEANRQVRYLSLGVSPIVADEPAYPRAFENTAISLLIFAGIYLMLSLTASVLREQVSA